MIIVMELETTQEVNETLSLLVNNGRTSFHVYADRNELLQKFAPPPPPPPPICPIQPIVSSNGIPTQFQLEQLQMGIYPILQQNNLLSVPQNPQMLQMPNQPPPSFIFPQNRESEMIDVENVEEQEDPENDNEKEENGGQEDRPQRLEQPLEQQQQPEQPEQQQQYAEETEDVPMEETARSEPETTVENVSKKLNFLNWNFGAALTPLPIDAVDDSQCSPEKEETPPIRVQPQQVLNVNPPEPQQERPSSMIIDTPEESPDPDSDLERAAQLAKSPGSHESEYEDNNTPVTASNSSPSPQQVHRVTTRSAKRQNEPLIEAAAVSKRHKSVGNTKEEIKCMKCKASIRFPSISLRSLTNHGITHTELKRFKCPIGNCSVQGRQRATLLSHIQKKHGTTAAGTDIKDCLTDTEWKELKRITTECFPMHHGVIMTD